MSKIGNAFKNGKAFIGFLTVGDPSLEDTLRFMKAMERGGADLIELGIPFSDPIAEGIVIQEADLRALAHNTSVDDAFHVVEEFRKESDLPVVFMGYVNPMFNYGYDRFFHKCAEIGVDGVIVPDVPFEERNEFADVARTYLLFCLDNQEAADKYMDLFCKKTGTDKRYVQQWLPLVAAAQLTKKRPEEAELLHSWLNVCDYQ